MFRASRPLFLFAPRASSTSSATRTPPGTSSLASRPRLSLHPRGFPAARFASGSSNPPPPKQPIDHRHEQKVAQETIKPRPDEVSSESSVRHVMEGFSTPRQSEAKLQEGLKHDIVGRRLFSQCAPSWKLKQSRESSKTRSAFLMSHENPISSALLARCPIWPLHSRQYSWLGILPKTCPLATPFTISYSSTMRQLGIF